MKKDSNHKPVIFYSNHVLHKQLTVSNCPSFFNLTWPEYTRK